MMTHGVPLLLLTAAVGYWVLERASSQKKDLKMIGQIVGAAIIVLSFVGVACKLYYITKYRKSFYCPAGKLCPLTSQQPSGK